MSGFSDTWLIVPCYNEGTVIFDVLTNARETFPNIVGVNDGSADDSAAQIRAAGAHLVDHPVNLGQGAAIQTGVEFARRTGREMLAAEATMQRNLVAYGLISRPRAAFNLAARTAYRTLPTGLLRRVYAALFHREG